MKTFGDKVQAGEGVGAEPLQEGSRAPKASAMEQTPDGTIASPALSLDMKVSVCVPYWERQPALDQMFTNYQEQYPSLDIEFSICDDGSPRPAVVTPEMGGGRATVLTRLPTKHRALNPCVPINCAVAESSGDVIVLTNPEIIHLTPILLDMMAMLEDPADYIIAACRDKKSGAWLAGPETKYDGGGRLPVPPDSHFHFLVMFHRQLWDAAGGFDESYRRGQACDDNDWLWRVYEAGARFKTTTRHVWHQPHRLAWGLRHNRDHFLNLWPESRRAAVIHRRTNEPTDSGSSVQRGVALPREVLHRRADEQHRGEGGVVAVRGDVELQSPQPGRGVDAARHSPRGGSRSVVSVPSVVVGEGSPSRQLAHDGSAAGEGPEPGVRDHYSGADEGSGDGTRRRSHLVHPEWALCLGGGEEVWKDVLEWEVIYGKPWDGLVIAANDVGSHWPRFLDHWVTLHPERMQPWRDLRKKYGFPSGYFTWGRRANVLDFVVRPWAGGSSGMLAVQVAHELGCVKTVLCGIPMSPTPHFVESMIHNRANWLAVAGHWRAWQRHLDKMTGWVKSMSGQTKETFGEPTMNWLRGVD